MKIRNQLLGLGLLLFAICTIFAYFILYFFLNELKPSIHNFPNIVQNNIASHNLETQILKISLYHNKSSYHFKDYMNHQHLRSKQKFFLYSNLLKEELSLIESNSHFQDSTMLKKLASKINSLEDLKVKSLVLNKLSLINFESENYIHTMLEKIMEQFHRAKSQTHISIKTFAKQTEKSSEQFEILFLLLLVLTASFVIATTIYVSNNLTLQLKKLQKFVTDIKNGDFEVKVEQLNTVELSDLADEFHLMGKSLQESTVSKSMLETEIIHRKKIQADAEQANIAKSEFLSTMSHELRTPLNSVIVLSSLLKESKLDATHQNYINLINSSGQSLLALINDILDFSKIEEGKFQLNIESFNIEETIHDVSEIYYPLMEDKGLEFYQEIDPTIPLFLMGDDVRIKQILINFIGNALKFTHKGYIKVKVSHDNSDSDSTNLRFEVEDSGIGISKDKVDSIFDRFTQENTSTTRNYGGSGLGLSICQQLTELMGGQIGVESLENSGSKFYASFKLSIDQTKSRKVHKLSNQPISIAFESRSRADTILDSLSSMKLTCSQVEDISCNDKIIISDFINLQTFCKANPDISQTTKNMQFITILSSIKQIEEFEILKLSLPSIRYIMFPFEFDKLLSLLSIEEEQVVQKVESSDPQFKMLALVVDDNRTNCFVAKEMLKKLGVQVEVAKNGLEALKAVQEKDFQIVFMDCQMPVMNGFEASIAIRKLNHDKYKNLPIIALSADIQLSTQNQCIQSGMNDYLSKPVSKNKLIEQLSKIDPSLIDVKPITSDHKLGNIPDYIDKERILDIIDHRLDAESFEFLQIIFESFTNSIDSQVSNMKLQASNHNYQNLKRELHTIRGTSANLGLTQVLHDISQIDLNQQLSHTLEKIDTLSGSMNQIKEWCNEYFSQENSIQS
ncbi:MAG: response regulator [Candidatus Cloacimonetes bacterium]|nr:response regulator [Candidatus Cloacimonadota bacterium]